MRLSRWLPVVVVLGCSGCDDVPAYRAPEIASPSNSSLVSTEGRDSYEWTWNQNGYFEAIRPSIYAFLEDSDSRFQIQSLFGQEDQAAWKRPEWMSDEVFDSFRLFTSCPPPKMILEVPLAEKMDPKKFFLDPRASKLVWCVGDRILWQDLATNSQDDPVSPNPSSIQSPLGIPQAILGDRDNESVFLLTDKTIARVRLSDASVLWETPLPQPADHWVRASDANTIAMVTTDRKCVICDGESGALTISPERVSSIHIAINPQGTRLLGNQQQQVVLWKFLESEGGFSKHQIPGIDPQKAIPLAGPTWDGWIDHQHYAFREHENYQGKLFPYAHFLQDARVVRSSLSDEESFYTLIGRGLPGSVYSDQVLVTDLVLVDGGSLHSQPVILEDARAIDVQISTKGDILVWVTPKSLRVMQRIPQAGSRLTYGTTQIARHLIDRMDWLQMEKVAIELRSHDWPRDFVSGETAYGNFAQSCAAIIANQQQLANPDSSEERPLPKVVSEWLESKRAFPYLVNACREQLLSNQARGAGFINQVSEENLKRHNLHEERKLAILQEILKEENPPGQAYEMMLYHLRSMGGGYQKGEEFTSQCMRKYPQYFGIHETNLWWMLPRWGGSAGQTQAYAEGVAKLYPREFQDRVFGILVNRMIRYNKSEFMKETEGFLQPKRLLEGVSQWCQDGEVPQMILENAAEVALRVNDPNARRFVEYNVKHFPVARKMGDTPVLLRALDEAKEALLQTPPSSSNGSRR